MGETRNHDEHQNRNDPVLTGWMTRKDLADELGLAVDTLAKWATAGTGPAFIRIGARTYYRRASVGAWLEQLEEQQNARRTR